MHSGPALVDPDVSDRDMLLFQQLFKRYIGLHLPVSKKALLQSRLGGRLHELGLRELGQYHAMIAAADGAAERQRAIDLITTNETYFFREQGHFDFLCSEFLPAWSGAKTLRAWSAASSTGEEAYTLAMLLDHHRPNAAWSVFASDISTRVLSFARRALYPMARGQNIPKAYLRRYCLRGTGEYEGHFLVDGELRRKVEFGQRNLTDLDAADDGDFDLIFLRNVIIYFDFPTKVQVVRSVIERLKPGGYLVVGHSESLHGMDLGLEMHSPSIYRKPQ
ncbi:methyltransferase domain-containing protein [Herbaspirillum sp. WKF16]|jgi:chemotaxis protein methyltransferase CheR|uniref:CheR family methyltransferase n=1 Tax=Herbaspirillum sp. WKF16 TaxID=3028312 RepID=UPI0023AA0627|nr:CheR family methyltransferase [Herbaspirillum sp. WKF16]WDZ96807.1 methyltransferase domain-containing protein [Herbaspirillum sp. WKF16]